MQKSKKFMVAFPKKCPRIIFLNPIAGPDVTQEFASIAMQKIKNIHSSVSEKRPKNHLLTLNPLLIPGLLFLKPNIQNQILHSVGLYCHIMQKIKKIDSTVAERMSKNLILGHLNPC